MSHPTTPPDPLDELAQLRASIIDHDRTWREDSMGSTPALAWYLREWSPWYHGFRSFDDAGGALDEHGGVRPGLLADLATTLRHHRGRAKTLGLRVPGDGHADGWRRLGWNPLRTLEGLGNIWQQGPGTAGPGSATHDTRSGGPMYPLIGKKGGGGGGGGMRRHHGRGRGRRQFFGGWGGWNYPSYYPWPYPWPWYGAYGWPGYEEYYEDMVSGRGGGGGGGGSSLRGRGMGSGMGMRGGGGRRGWSSEPWPGAAYGGSFGEQWLGDSAPLMYVPQTGEPNLDEEQEPMMVSGDNELFALLPMLAPGAGGLHCDMHIGPDLRLMIRLCVDQACYEASADLSGVLRHLADGVAAYHDRLHARQPAAVPPPASSPAAVQDVTSKANAAVQSAGNMLVGALYDQHVSDITSGWLDGLKKAALFAVSPALALHKEIGGTLKQLKGPITIAATAAATAYGGPAGGAAASQLVGPLVDSLADGDAGRLVEGLQQQAGADPVVNKALDDAQKAVANTTAAYHLGRTAARAAEGDQGSARKIAEVEEAATRGDRGAIQAMQIMAAILQQAITNQAQGAQARASEVRSGRAVTVQRKVSGEQARLRRDASRAAQDVRKQLGSKFLGVVLEKGSDTRDPGRVTMTETTYVEAFQSADEANAWLFGVEMMEPPTHLYAAYYDASSPSWPTARRESFGQSPSRAPTTSSGVFWPFALGALGGGLGGTYLANRSMTRQIVDAAARGQGIYHEGRHLYSPVTTAPVPPVPAPPAAAPIPTMSGAGPLLPLLAFGAGGAAGWWGHQWWRDHKASVAESAAAAAAESAASSVPPGTPPGPPPATATPGPATSSGWW